MKFSDVLLLLSLLLISQGVTGQECDSTFGNYKHSTGDSRPMCDWIWKDIVDKDTTCFVLVKEAMSFERAEEYCKTKYDGHLASPHLDLENHYLRVKLMEEFSTEVQLGEKVLVWHGLKLEEATRNRQTRGRFTNGRKMKYTDWLRDDENSKSYDEDISNRCTIYFAYLRVRSYFHWLTEACEEEHPFICEIKQGA